MPAVIDGAHRSAPQDTRGVYRLQDLANAVLVPTLPHFLPYNFIQVLVMSFLMDSLVFSMYVIMSSTNTAYIAISLYNWMLFVHLLPNSSAENFQCMLYRTSKNGHFCLST